LPQQRPYAVYNIKLEARVRTLLELKLASYVNKSDEGKGQL